MQKTSSISAEAQVVHLLMNDHCSSKHRQAPEQSRLRFDHGVDFSLFGLKVPEVSGVVGVVHVVGVVVAPGGVAAPAQVSILMDVHRSGLRAAVGGEATEPHQDLEFSRGTVLPEQSMAVHFGEAVGQRGAGSHFAGCVQRAIVLQSFWWSQRVTGGPNALLVASQQNQESSFQHSQ